VFREADREAGREGGQMMEREKASTTLKMTPEEHRELVALLQFQARTITEEQFRAILAINGRDIFKTVEVDQMVVAVSKSMVKVIH
jgi:hypothetical protein